MYETYRKFDLTAEHIALLGRATVRWEDCEHGAPAIDCKRPYGNSTVIQDIGEILGISPAGTEGEYTQDQRDYMDRIHRETTTALQIILRTQSFTPGSYRADKYQDDWALVPR